MSQNAKTILVACALLIVSAGGIIYLSTERSAATDQASVTSDQSMTKGAAARASGLA